MSARNGQRTGGRGGGTGFTLIELLVIVAVISLLISILAPSLSKAREMARRAVCRSNLHHIFLGFAAYAADHNGKMPNTLSFWAAEYYISKPAAHELLPAYFGITPGTDAGGNPIVEYDSRAAFFFCPTFSLNLPRAYGRDAEWWWEVLGEEAVGNTYGIGYNLFTNRGTEDASAEPWIVTKLEANIPERALGTDINIPYGPYVVGSDEWYWNMWGVAHRSKDWNDPPEGCNVSYLSGGVKWRPFEKMEPRFYGQWWGVWW